MECEALWQTVLGELELQISKANFTTWFKQTLLISFDQGHATIGVPNVFTQKWLENKYHKEIFRSLQHATNDAVQKITYTIQTKRDVIAPSNPSSSNFSPSVHILPQATETMSVQVEVDPRSNLNPRYIFDTFIVGPSNELVTAACRAVASSPGRQYNPLFIYGGVGLGKTHLMQAVGNAILQMYPGRNVRYITTEQFSQEYLNALQNHKMAEFKSTYRDVDVLIADDVQFLAGKEKTQEEFFHLFNTLYEDNKQIILSSDRLPKMIPTLEDRLRSRFEGGMIADISKPELETRIAILREKSRQKNAAFGDEIYRFIATNVQNNVRELEGALNRVIAHCQLNNRQPTLPDVQNILATMLSSPKKKALAPRMIVEAVSQFYSIETEDITGRSRKKELVTPRQIAMYLMRCEIEASFPTIGRELGGKDHTTAMHAVSKIESEIEKNDSLREEIDLIRQKLYLPA